MKRLLALSFLLISVEGWASFVPGPIQVNNGAGTATGVGYATGNSSVPVNILIGGSAVSTSNPLPIQSTGTTTVAGTITANPGSGQFQVTGSTVGAIPLASATVNTVNTYSAGLQYLTQTTTGTLRQDLSTWGNGTTLSTTNPIPVQSTGSTTVNGTITANAGTGTFATQSTGTQTTNGNLSDNGAAATSNRVGVLDGIYIKTGYGNGTAGTAGNNAASEYGTDHLLHTTAWPSVSGYSYHASSVVTVAATATDIASLSGNSSSTTLVTGIRISCTQTTAGNVTLSILRRSTADSGGSSSPVSTMTVVGDDPQYGAARSTAAYVYTGNMTLGTLTGALDIAKIGCMATGTATPNDVYITPSWWRTKPQVLRSTNDVLAVSLATPVDKAGVTVTGGIFTITFEFMEASPITP